MSRWYTFAPMRFPANPSFFWRDSGLYSRGLRQLGHESKVILLGPAFEDDPPEVIRASPEELASAEWWRSLGLDGVIMVAWARHRDTPFVRAIAESGTPLALHSDSNGNPYPVGRLLETVKTFWRAERGTGASLLHRTAVFLKALTLFTAVIFIKHNYLKYRHLRYANAVILTTPTSLEGHARLCAFYGGKHHGVNLRLTGYPIADNFRWDPAIPKQKRIISIGRWEDLKQKRPFVLMAVSERIARLHPDLEIDIFGSATDALAKWHGSLDAPLRARIHLHGVQPGETVVQAIQAAQVSFFPSAHEGGPQALFECLACGATTVGLDSPDLPGARYAAELGHAELASEDTTEACVAALDRALQKWERGEYSPRQISDAWICRSHVTRLLPEILGIAAHSAPPIALKPKL